MSLSASGFSFKLGTEVGECTSIAHEFGLHDFGGELVELVGCKNGTIRVEKPSSITTPGAFEDAADAGAEGRSNTGVKTLGMAVVGVVGLEVGVSNPMFRGGRVD